jgi:hypothetical protein
MKNDDILLEAEALAVEALTQVEALLASRIKRAVAEARRRGRAVEELHAVRADDLCWLDIVKLYEEFGLPVPDNSVGSQQEMLKNCERYIRCMTTEGGNWPTYRELAGALGETLQALNSVHLRSWEHSEEQEERCAVCRTVRRATILSRQVEENYRCESPPEEQDPSVISSHWTDRERLRVIYAEAVLLARAKILGTQNITQRIAYLAAHAPEFLEMNRETFRDALQYLEEHKANILK